MPRNLLQALPIAVGLGLACSGAASVWSLLGVMDRNGGAPGGYGVALKHKTAAVEYIVAQAGDRPAALVGDTRTRTPLPGAEEYEYLLRLAREKSPSARRPETGPRRDFVIIDLYRYNLSAAELEFVNTLAPRRFGPLLVGALPERELSGQAHQAPPAEITKP